MEGVRRVVESASEVSSGLVTRGRVCDLAEEEESGGGDVLDSKEEGFVEIEDEGFFFFCRDCGCTHHDGSGCCGSFCAFFIPFEENFVEDVLEVDVIVRGFGCDIAEVSVAGGDVKRGENIEFV